MLHISKEANMAQIEYKGETLYIRKTEYQNGNLAVVADCADGERYGTITVNLVDAFTPPGTGYVDTNNLDPELVKALIDAGLMTSLEVATPCGFCIYPLYQFNLGD